MFEVVAALVGEEAGDVEAVCDCSFDLREEVGDLIQVVCDDDAGGAEEEIAVLIRWIEARGFEEDGAGVRRDGCADVLGKTNPVRGGL